MDKLEEQIKHILEVVQRLYLFYCIPMVSYNKDTNEVIMTYRWTSVEMEQIYKEQLQLLEYLTLKQKEQQEILYRTKEKRGHHGTYKLNDRS